MMRSYKGDSERTLQHSLADTGRRNGCGNKREKRLGLCMPGRVPDAPDASRVYVFTPLPLLLAPLHYGSVYEDLNSYVRN